MKMKFTGTPNLVVTDRHTHKVVLRFDEKGEFVTEDLAIIGRAYGKFDSLEIKDEIIPDENTLKDEEIRAKGKELKIRNAHNMGIDKLKEKIKEIEEA